MGGVHGHIERGREVNGGGFAHTASAGGAGGFEAALQAARGQGGQQQEVNRPFNSRAQQLASQYNVIGSVPALRSAAQEGRLSFDSQANLDAFEAMMLASPSFARDVLGEIGQRGQLHVRSSNQPYSFWDSRRPNDIYISNAQATDPGMRAYIIAHEFGHYRERGNGGAPHRGLGLQDGHGAYVARYVSEGWGIPMQYANLHYGDNPQT